jgi:hypothetical protein
MQRLPLLLDDRRQWYDHFTGDDTDSVLFCPSASPPPVGSPIIVDVSFKTGPRLFLRGIVIWRRTRQSTDAKVATGAGVRLPSSEKPKIDFINGYSRGGLLDQRAGSRRLPVRLRTTYTSRHGRRMNFTRDISEEGVSLNCAEPVPIKSPIHLDISFPQGIGTYKLQGWVVRHISDEQGEGMAVSLTFASQSDRYELAGAVRRVEKLLLEGKLADQHLY